MNRIVIAMLCFALLQTALAQNRQETIPRKQQSLASGVIDRVLGLVFTVLMWLNTFIYRITGGRFGVEAYCF